MLKIEYFTIEKFWNIISTKIALNKSMGIFTGISLKTYEVEINNIFHKIFCQSFCTNNYM